MTQRYIPAVSRNPLKLALSLLRAENPAARSALFFAGLGLACAPLDMMLQAFESRRLRRADPPRLPIVLVVGPPRSGTTLIAQYLINSLECCYLNNLTSVFPRSPLTVNALWGKNSIASEGDYFAFYGKSRRWRGANDALYIWDRWLGSDRSRVPDSLVAGSEEAMPRFFGALQALYGLPVVNKVNRLNVCADLVAPVLPEARFVFVNRRPVDLAQSLLVARERIGRDMSSAYGVQHPDAEPSDPELDVCRQIRFHDARMREQISRLPPERVFSVQYEDFCASPASLRDSILKSSNALSLRPSAEAESCSFRVSDRPKVAAQTVARLRSLLVRDERQD